MMRKLFLVASMISAAVLGMEKWGVGPIAPGYDTGFQSEWKMVESKRVLLLETGVRDIKVLVHLKLSDMPLTSSVEAHLQGKNLKVHRDSEDPEWIKISAPGDTETETPKFEWPSGVPLKLWFADTNQSSGRVEDYTVYLADHDYDSLDRSIRRIAVS